MWHRYGRPKGILRLLSTLTAENDPQDQAAYSARLVIVPYSRSGSRKCLPGDNLEQPIIITPEPLNHHKINQWHENNLPIVFLIDNFNLSKERNEKKSTLLKLHYLTSPELVDWTSCVSNDDRNQKEVMRRTKRMICCVIVCCLLCADFW